MGNTEFTIIATAGGIIVLNLVNKIIWDWFKNRKGNPNSLEKRLNEHIKAVVYRDTCEATHKGVDQRFDHIDKKLDSILIELKQLNK